MKRNLTVFVLALLLFSGCNKTHHYYADSYVLAYEFFSDIYLSESEGNIVVNVSIDRNKGMVEFRSEGDARQTYDSLCVANGDYNFRHSVWLLMDNIAFGDGPISYSPNIVSVDVVSNQDFDAKHPAGKSLNDLINYTFRSYKSYISSRYDDKLRPNLQSGTTKLLSEISDEDLAVPANLHSDILGSFQFTRLPENPEILHNITVNMTSDKNGKLFCASIDYSFGENIFKQVAE